MYRKPEISALSLVGTYRRSGRRKHHRSTFRQRLPGRPPDAARYESVFLNPGYGYGVSLVPSEDMEAGGILPHVEAHVTPSGSLEYEYSAKGRLCQFNPPQAPCGGRERIGWTLE